MAAVSIAMFWLAHNKTKKKNEQKKLHSYSQYHQQLKNKLDHFVYCMVLNRLWIFVLRWIVPIQMLCIFPCVNEYEYRISHSLIFCFVYIFSWQFFCVADFIINSISINEALYVHHSHGNRNFIFIVQKYWVTR